MALSSNGAMKYVDRLDNGALVRMKIMRSARLLSYLHAWFLFPLSLAGCATDPEYVGLTQPTVFEVPYRIEAEYGGFSNVSDILLIDTLGKVVVSDFEQKSVLIWDLETRAIERNVELGFAPHTMALDENNSILYIVGSENIATVYFNPYTHKYLQIEDIGGDYVELSELPFPIYPTNSFIVPEIDTLFLNNLYESNLITIDLDEFHRYYETIFLNQIFLSDSSAYEIFIPNSQSIIASRLGQNIVTIMSTEGFVLSNIEFEEHDTFAVAAINVADVGNSLQSSGATIGSDEESFVSEGTGTEDLNRFVLFVGEPDGSEFWSLLVKVKAPLVALQGPDWSQAAQTSIEVESVLLLGFDQPWDVEQLEPKTITKQFGDAGKFTVPLMSFETTASGDLFVYSQSFREISVYTVSTIGQTPGVHSVGSIPLDAPPTHLAVNSDGTVLAFVSDDGTLRILRRIDATSGGA